MPSNWSTWLSLGLLLSALAYLLHVNRGLSKTPREILPISPARFDKATIQATHRRLVEHPISAESVLPPKTGRRYVVVGGAGFLPGWIVIQLIQRGEDPRRIRVLDVNLPTRRDLTSGPASQVAFFQVDISDADAVMNAFLAPWPDAETAHLPLTVFHGASNIRFWERVAWLMPLSTRVNADGTAHILAAARAAHASVLIYTSSASIATKRVRFWLWPWERAPKHYVQVYDDDVARHIPSGEELKHDRYFCNYAASKAMAEKLVREADGTRSGAGELRTGCIRPGNGVFGPGGDILCGAYLVRGTNPTWVRHIIQSYVYVENCSLAHLLYEQRLLELISGSSHPDIGGLAFTITDPNPPVSFGDVYLTLSTLTNGKTTFPDLPPALMLSLAYLLEALYLSRLAYPFLGWFLPRVKGDLINLQPSLFSLAQVHLVFGDSRARKSPQEGGLGYKAPWTTLEGLCKLCIEWDRTGGRVEGRQVHGGGVSLGFGFQKAHMGEGSKESEAEVVEEIKRD